MRAILILLALVAAWFVLTRFVFPKIGIDFKGG